MPPPTYTSSSPIVYIPISDWIDRLVGKRLVTSSSTFTDLNGATVFHNALTPTALVYHIGTGSSPMLRLPTELRLKILAYVFQKTKPDDWVSCHYGATPASVIFTCKLMYTDAKELALKACTCDYETLPDGHQMTGYGRPWSSIMASRYERLSARFNEKNVCETVSYE